MDGGHKHKLFEEKRLQFTLSDNMLFGKFHLLYANVSTSFSTLHHSQACLGRTLVAQQKNVLLSVLPLLLCMRNSPHLHLDVVLFAVVARTAGGVSCVRGRIYKVFVLIIGGGSSKKTRTLELP